MSWRVRGTLVVVAVGIATIATVALQSTSTHKPPTPAPHLRSVDSVTIRTGPSIAPALKREFGLLSPREETVPLPQIAKSLIADPMGAGAGVGADLADAGSTSVGLGRARVWLIPGRRGACLANAEPAGNIGVVCASLAKVLSGALWTVDALPLDAGGKISPVLLGVAPNGNRVVMVYWTRGTPTAVGVRRNLYYAPIGKHGGWRFVRMTGRSSKRITVVGIPRLPF
jgi:hypothetical protein